jgi:oligosaccharyltransferase complex subunit alpha (ribophorin I)
MERSTHITYLDTIGRPKITLQAERVTDRHAGLVYVCLVCSSFLFLT